MKITSKTERFTRKFALIGLVAAVVITIGLTGGCGDDIRVGQVFGEGPIVYAADGTRTVAGYLYRLDVSNGLFKVVGPIKDSSDNAYPVGGMDFGPDGKLYATTHNGCYHGSGPAVLITINPSNGVATVVGNLDEGGTTNHPCIGDIAFVGNTLFGWTENGDDLVSIDTSTGAVTIIGDSGISSAGDAMVYDANGDRLLVQADCVPGDFYEMNRTTGAGISAFTVPDPEGSGECLSAGVLIDDTIYAVFDSFVADHRYIVGIDLTTGNLSGGAIVPPGIDALAVR